MTPSLRVLMLEDSPADAELMLRELRRAGLEVQWQRVDCEADFVAALATAPDVILADYSLPQFDGLRALEILKRQQLDIPFIFVSGCIGEDLAVQALGKGAVDYLLKDRLSRLGEAVRHAVEQAHLRRENHRTEQLLLQRLRLTRLSADVGLALTRTEGVQEMLHLCVESVVRNLEAAFARIWTLNSADNTLELQASAGLYTHLDGSHRRVPVGQFKIGQIAQERQPHLTNDVLNDPRISDPEWARREGMTAFAGYPLLVDNRLIGVMAMFARQPLSHFVLESLEHIADMIALGIERKQSQQELHRSEDRLRAFIAGAQDIIFDLNPEGEFLTLNPYFERVTGWPVSEWLGKPLPLLLHPDDLASGLEIFAQVMAGATPPRFEVRLKTQPGSPATVEITMAPQVEGGAIVGAGGIARDVTDHKRLEEQYRQAQKMEAVGRLAGGVAHDFNNLLTIINGHSDILLDKLRSGDPLRDSIKEIHRAGERAALLTRQLLTFSRKQVLHFTVLDLNALLTDMEKMLGRLIGEDIELVVRPAPQLWEVKGDAGQMEQIVMNLLVNARDAMPTGGRVTIETANIELDESYAASHLNCHGGEHVLLAVSDNGCGMDMALRKQIFEPFFTTKGPDRGTGLGLATVFGIVTQAGGHIEVYSELGLGTTFKVYLPRCCGGSTPSGKSNPGLKIIPRGTETVLLVEDEDGLRMLAQLVLQRQGYQVLDARNGGEALLICEQYHDPIQLLVTDVVMPQMSGCQLAKRLRAERPEMEVLYLSGYTDDAIVRHGVLSGEAPFLQKPFTPAVLARKVREVLDRESALQPGPAGLATGCQPANSLSNPSAVARPT